MASTDSRHFGFPRRVVGHYLFFCLGSVLLLLAGAVVASDQVLKAQATGGALSRVGRLAAAIEMDRLHADGARLPELLDEARSAGRLAYAAVVGPDGRFVAHTDRSLVGAVAIESVGSQLRWGDIDGVRFQDETGRVVNEYHASLRVDDATIGDLRVAIAEPGLSCLLASFGEYAPWAVLAPVVLIAIGGWRLARTAGPLAGIDSRLSGVARLPHLESPELDPIPATSLAAVGWNRLVDHVQELAVSSARESDGLGAQAKAINDGLPSDALQSLPEGVAVTDAEGRIEFANRAISALLGTSEELLGEPLQDLLESLSPEQANPLVDANPNTEAIAELPLPTDDGGRTLRLARAPLGGDAASGHVWTLRDITQQKLAEASRDQFIDTATHELRTPLANIKAYAETLATCEMTDVEQQKEFCNTINTEATRLARFVDDLLSISSIEVGSLGITRMNVDVRRLIQEAADKIKPLMVQRELAFEVKLSEKLGEAKLDKDKIAGLLVNLLGNAAKYTPEGGTVTLAAVRQEDQLKIEVRDTGVGISEEEQQLVFDKFFRSDNPEVRDEVGTGLGLSLAREIARLHRGELHLDSVLGQGSTFTALLPVN